MKYSINGTGNIVAERDIYSLGGFIPKGTVGGKIASEEQLSQDGDCWLAAGDISARPDVVIKDNAYIGTFNPGAVVTHTDGVTEFSGDTIIPGAIMVRNPIADLVNNFYAKDSFIGVSMDVLCGPATATAAFPFEQGRYKESSPKGTLFTSAEMKVNADSFVRSTATIRPGKDTYVYIPAGFSARIYWAYTDAANQLAYSGESETVSKALHKLNHPIYKVCMIGIARGNALTPTELLASGAKILGHISGSVNVDIRPESASGKYVMDNSSLIMNTDNFGLATTQLRLLAGSMYDTTMYTKTDGQNYKLYGTFRNVERLEYNQYFADIHRGNANRDNYIVASDSPLVRVEAGTIADSIVNAGGVTLRRCIVPKANFDPDPVNGDTYEDIDFSYANEDLGFSMPGYAVLSSSHKQGLYRVRAGVDITQGLVSHKGNLDATARLYPKIDYIPLDGSLIEQGTYYGEPVHYEADKQDHLARVRTKFPLPTRGADFPELPAGFGVRAIVYLDDDFVCKLNVTDPTTIESTYPYYVMTFKRDDSTVLSAKDFIALGASLGSSNYNVTPEITGSAYVGAGVTVRGDVKLIGDPYVNRVFDVNMWERGGISNAGNGWEVSKNPPGGPADANRRRLKNVIQVEPGATITCNSGYRVNCYFYDSAGTYLGSSGWGQPDSTVPANSAFVGIIIKKATAAADEGGLIEGSDIPLANVKYLRAFERRRYITNELDRTSPKDILLGLDLWVKNSVSTSEANKGRYFKELIGVSNKYLISKSPINAGSAWSFSTGAPETYAHSSSSWDAVTKFLGSGTAANAALMEVEIRAKSGGDLSLSDITNTRLVLEFVPQPRIIVPYGASGISVNGMRIRMYDNAVLSRNLNQQGEIVLHGDAVMGYDFNSGSCMCSNGHSDAIIKLP